MSAPAPARLAAMPDSQPAPARGIKPLASLLAHRRVAAALLVGTILLGLPAAWLKGQAVYLSEAAVHVSPRFMKNLKGDNELDFQSNSQYREFVQQQVKTINRQDILAEALSRLADKNVAWAEKGETPGHAVRRLQVALEVKPVPDTYLVTISLEGKKAEGLAEIVNAVINVYLEKARNEDFYGADQRIAALRKRQAELLAEIRVRNEQRTTIAQTLGVTTFVENNLNPYDQIVISGSNAVDEARRQRIKTDSQLAVLSRPGAKHQDQTLEALVQDNVAKDPGLNALKANLSKRRADLLTAASGLTADHPGRRAAEREIREIDAELASQTLLVAGELKQALRERMEAEAAQSRQVEERLSQEHRELRERATAYATLFREALEINADIGRSQKELDSIDERVNFLQLESSAPGFVRIATWAAPPEEPVRGGKIKILLLFVIAGLVLAVAVPVGMDMFDDRIHSPNDLQNVLGFAPVGWILERGSEKIDAVARDQMLRLASAVNRESGRYASRIFMFTGVESGSGATGMVLELAKQLTGLGISSIAVEANAFRPDPRYAGTGEKPGLAEALRGASDIAACIQPGSGGLPDRIAAGTAPGERHLPAVTRLKDTLDGLSGNYQLILVDAPPLLLSADSELLAAGCDAAILVVEAQTTVRGAVARTARLLERIAPPVVGVVLNRVRVLQGGGYFGQLIETYHHARHAPASAEICKASIIQRIFRLLPKKSGGLS